MLVCKAKVLKGRAVPIAAGLPCPIFSGLFAKADCFMEAAMLARHSRLGAPWTTPAAVLAILTMVGLVGPTRDAQAQERALGSPPTFVINSPQELRAPPPPDQTTT